MDSSLVNIFFFIVIIVVIGFTVYGIRNNRIKKKNKE
jgi:hypothetical protein